MLSDKERLNVLHDICKYKNRKHGPLKQNKIAELLNLSEKEISAILKKGFDDGLVEITFKSPMDHDLERELGSRLAGTSVTKIFVGVAKDSSGYIAARFLENEKPSGKTIVLDGGLTVGEFVDQLKLPNSTKLTVIPIAADPPSYTISAYEPHDSAIDQAPEFAP